MTCSFIILDLHRKKDSKFVLVKKKKKKKKNLVTCREIFVWVNIN